MKNRRIGHYLYLFPILFLWNTAKTQTYSLNWGSSFSPLWANGNTSGTATDIGGSGINCNVNMPIIGNGAFTYYNPGYNPTVNRNNSYSSFPYFQVQNSIDAMKISVDFADRTSYVDITFNFSNSISNLKFGIADIDKFSVITPYTYLDRVIITGTGPFGPAIPTLTRYISNNYFDIFGDTAIAIKDNGFTGSNSLMQGTPDQNSTVFVDFGINAITSVNIRYGGLNDPEILADPVVQEIAIGNLSFKKYTPVPLSLISFVGERNGNNIIAKWKTLNETNVSRYELEYSVDDLNYFKGAETLAKNLETNNYQLTLFNYTGSHYFLRLKSIDIDGNFKYSKVVNIQSKDTKQRALIISPNPVSDIMHIRFNSDISAPTDIRIIDVFGRLVYHESKQMFRGENVFTLKTQPYLSRGIYTLQVLMKDEMISTQFLNN